MRIRLEDGVNLFVDVAGPAVEVKAEVIVERPTIVLLHGGPGLDHTVFKPAFDPLTDFAQLVYVDHRGCGRSDDGPVEDWNLNQWADDVASVIQILGLEKPIVLGTSFGGFVAQRFAARHPEAASGLVLMSTAPRTDVGATLKCIAEIGGEAARDAAAQFFTDAAAPGVVDDYFGKCLDLYTHGAVDLAAIARIIQRPEVMMHFFGKGGEMYEIDLQNDLEAIELPTLVVHGKDDPIFPLELAEEIPRFLDRNCPVTRTQFVAIPNCGHLSEQDAPDQIVAAITNFFAL